MVDKLKTSQNMKTSQILTSDFTADELVNLHTHYLEAAKKACSDKITFFQSEINKGFTGMGHLDNLKLYSTEFRKWVEIVRAATARDAKNDAEFYAACEQ